MERYSDEAIRIIDELHTERLDYHSEYLPLIDAAQLLAAYEDTGLTPQEVVELKARMEGQWIPCSERLPKEKQRVIVRCATVGTTVGWILWGEWMKDFRISATWTHCGIVFHSPWDIFLQNIEKGYIRLMREEAEAMLEGGTPDAEAD